MSIINTFLSFLYAVSSNSTIIDNNSSIDNTPVYLQNMATPLLTENHHNTHSFLNNRLEYRLNYILDTDYETNVLPVKVLDHPIFLKFGIKCSNPLLFLSIIVISPEIEILGKLDLFGNVACGVLEGNIIIVSWGGSKEDLSEL